MIVTKKLSTKISVKDLNNFKSPKAFKNQQNSVLHLALLLSSSKNLQKQCVINPNCIEYHFFVAFKNSDINGRTDYR